MTEELSADGEVWDGVPLWADEYPIERQLRPDQLGGTSASAWVVSAGAGARGGETRLVKYAESPEAAVEVVIDAPPEAVWPLISDITTPARFSPELKGANWVSDTRGLGATFHGHNKHDAVGEWTTTSTITAYEEGQTFEWTVGDLDNKTARWRFDIAPHQAGTALRFSAEMGPGPSGLSMVIEKMPDREEDIVAHRLAEWTNNMQETANGIKALAEN